MSFHSNDEVALEQMEFSYIKECKDTKELERILRKLKSGSEGYFPHLTTYCEERLAELNPKSQLLIKDGLPANKYDVDKKEWENIQKEMNEFEKIGKDNAGNADYNNVNLPPIRNSTVITTDGKKSKNEEWGKPSKDRISSSNYREWDKFDADTAASNVDKKISAESNTSSINAEDINIQHLVDTAGMSEEEKVSMANREKDKGNEAFHSKDFKEALAYYSRSISIQPSLAAYNNRALASIKLKKFDDAVKDCDKVLEDEPDNVKALLRRATAKKGLKNYHAAKLDIQKTLSLEPGNKQAKSMLAEIITADSKNTKTESKGKRIKIEEVEGSGEEDADEDSAENSTIANGYHKKLENEVDDTDGNICSTKKNKSSDQEPEERGMDQDRSSPEQRSEVESKKESSSETISEQRPQAAEPSEPAQAPVVAPPPPPSLPSTTLSFKDEAQKLYLAGQYGRSSELYTKAIQTLMPDKDVHAVSLATLYSNRAACHYQTGDMRQCIQDCDDALKFGPFLTKPYLRRAKAYETLERYRQAYVDYRNVLRIDPTNKSAQDGSARCMMVLKEQDGSNWREKLPKSDVQPQTFIPPILTTVAKSASSATTATSTTVKMSTGMASSHQTLSTPENDVKVEEKLNVEEDHQNEAGGNVEIAAQSENEANMAAEETLKRVASEEAGANKDKDDNVPSIQEQYQAAKEKGNMHHKKGEYEQAVKCYSECVDLDRTQTVGFTNRALCHIKLNQPLLAVSDCSTALKLDDKNVKALYRRAQSRKMLGEYKEALKDLKTLLNIEPTNKTAIKDLETVKELFREELRVKQTQAVPSAPPQATPKTQATASSTTPVKPTVSPSTEKSEISAKKKKKNNRKKIQIKEVEGSDDDEELKKDTISEPQEVTSTEQVKEVEVSKCEAVEEAEKKESAENEKPKEGTSNVKTPPKNEGKKKKKKKSNNKGANSQTPVDTLPVDLKAGTPFEFSQSWASIHKRPDCIERLADLLLLVQPSKLPQIVSHTLDGELLTALVQSLESAAVFTKSPKVYNCYDVSIICR
ncbi:sperm-associated antigen 1-like isoform X2 [Anneissia japonica]|uniref:sperm-associated antigen 1-like isoform X2 n=1 Tax=Anneissia japonica TaxID=1529436 RepID=UPI001425B4A4|nr:sperm-associated antigen 1-like isoform X2 [Anneissia japonica]